MIIGLCSFGEQFCGSLCCIINAELNQEKTEKFYLKEDAQLRKKWQKFRIKEMLALRGICTPSCVSPVRAGPATR